MLDKGFVAVANGRGGLIKIVRNKFGELCGNFQPYVQSMKDWTIRYTTLNANIVFLVTLFGSQEFCKHFKLPTEKKNERGHKRLS
jgi:hypothetical protein